MAKPSIGADLTFGGSSSLATWGMMCVNPLAHPRWIDYLPRLIHEASHNALFALAGDEQLVTNDPDALYYSPIRDCARPMDGIFHAAFVSAEEVLSADRMLAVLENPAGIDAGAGAHLASDTTHDRSTFDQSLNADERSRLINFLNATRTASLETARSCLAVVDRDGEVTPTGEACLASVRALMEPSA